MKRDRNRDRDRLNKSVLSKEGLNRGFTGVTFLPLQCRYSAYLFVRDIVAYDILFSVYNFICFS